MADIARGLVLSERVTDARSLLDQWLTLYDRSNTAFPQTREVWYVEQTLTALMVAASWAVDIPAVGEVRSKRVRASGPSGGRVDVLVQLPDGRAAIEAKIHWFDNVDAFEAVLGNLEAAEIDARSVDPNFAGRRLALCSGVLEKGNSDLAKLLDLAINKATSMRLDVVAWVFSVVTPEVVRFPGGIVLSRVYEGAAPAGP